jgi:hypothetical protein
LNIVYPVCPAMTSLAYQAILLAVKRCHVTLAIIAALSCSCRPTPPPAADAARRVDSTPAGPPLAITDVSFAGPAGHRRDASFMPGEVVVCLFSVSGFTYKEQRADIRADLRIMGPEGQLILLEQDLEVVKGAAPSLRPGLLRGAASLRVSPAAPPGRHEVTVTVRDRLSRGAGSARGSFTLLGTPPPGENRLTLAELRWAAGGEAPAGAVLPLAFTARHLSTPRVAGKGHELDLSVEATLLDAGGKSVTTRQDRLLHRQLTFAPAAYPLEYLLAVPATAAPGDYQVSVTLRDGLDGGRATGQLPLRVLPPSFGVRTLHVHDAAGLPRTTFLLGEQIFVRLAVHGLVVRQGQVDAAVDLAVAGPDGGVYLARKDAATAAGASSRAVASAGRFPAQLPLVLPLVAPTGKYRLVLRARDRLARKESVAELPIELRGSAPPPLSEFKVDTLEVRQRPDLLPEKGDTFGAGRTYHLTLWIGGAKLREQKKLLYAAHIEATLRLRDLAGQVVQEQKRLFRFERELTYRPLRVLIPATWTVSALRSGLYDLEVEANDLLTDRSSQMRRRVEVVSP